MVIIDESKTMAAAVGLIKDALMGDDKPFATLSEINECMVELTQHYIDYSPIEFIPDELKDAYRPFYVGACELLSRFSIPVTSLSTILSTSGSDGFCMLLIEDK